MEQNSSRLVSSDESWLQKIQERGAVHQNSAPLLLCSQEHQQACDDRGVRCQRRVCEYVGAHLYCMSASPSVSVSKSCSKLCELVRALYPLPGETGLVSKLDSVIGSSENPNEAISISASALLPGVSVRSPQARAQPFLFSPDGKWGGVGSGDEERQVNFKPFQLLWRWLQQNRQQWMDGWGYGRSLN